jgi:CheY-like chemotaxis protein
MALFKRRPPTERDSPLDRELATLDAVLANYPAGYEIAFGAATRCPRCAKTGFVTAVNRFDGVTQTQCLDCNTEWTITERALATHRARVVSSSAMAGARVDPVSAAVDALGTLGLAPPDLKPANGGPLQLLLVEDDPADAAMIQSILRPVTPHGVQIACVSTRHEGENAARLGFDVVLLDLNLPESSGMTTLRSFRQACPEAPVCVCTGQDTIDPDWHRFAQQHLPKRDLPRLLGASMSGATELLTLLRATVNTTLAT